MNRTTVDFRIDDRIKSNILFSSHILQYYYTLGYQNTGINIRQDLHQFSCTKILFYITLFIWREDVFAVICTHLIVIQSNWVSTVKVLWHEISESYELIDGAFGISEKHTCHGNWHLKTKYLIESMPITDQININILFQFTILVLHETIF